MFDTALTRLKFVDAVTIMEDPTEWMARGNNGMPQNLATFSDLIKQVESWVSYGNYILTIKILRLRAALFAPQGVQVSPEEHPWMINCVLEVAQALWSACGHIMRSDALTARNMKP